MADPVFKVIADDRRKKKLVTASTLSDLISKARDKLQLTSATLKVVLDEDGTEIDDDDALVAFAAGAKGIGTLMVLDSEKHWASEFSENIPDNSQTTGIDASNLTQRPSGSSDTAQEENFDLVSLWSKFPVKLLEACQKGDIPSPTDRRTMASTIADFMLNEIKDTRRKTADVIAKNIVAKYPKSFMDNIGGRTVGLGHETLKIQIYNAVIYRKDHEKKRPVSHLQDEDSDSEAGPAVECPVSRKFDQYGCTDYQPILPPEETKGTQEEKRLLLCNLHQSDEQDEEKVHALMADTYPTQRLALNEEKRDLGQSLRRWPYLCKSKFLLTHAKRLLGKPVEEVWRTNLEHKGQAAVAYLKMTYRGQVKKTSTKTLTSAQKIATEGLRLFNEAKAAVVAERYDLPKTGVIFPIIANHFKEDVQYLYRIFSIDVEDEKIISEASPYPLLIIKGQSLYDEEAAFSILVEQSSFIVANGFIDGFLTLLMAYYVFGYVYAPEVAKTLEFIQRYFLDINPDLGQKRGVKKRKTFTFDSKVMKLANAIDEFAKLMKD